MLQIVLIILSTVLVSFYFFPFEFVFLAGVNTKMAMAGMALLLLGVRMARRGNASIDRDFMTVSIYAILVSIAGWLSVVYNNTSDYTFSNYIISMWVWAGGAYVVWLWLKEVHGAVSVELLCRYLIVVCVAQCFIAVLIDSYPPVKQFVDGFLSSDNAYMGVAEGRLYGIGCALDVAGLRFSAVLVMIAFLCVKEVPEGKRNLTGWYVFAFLIIAVVGNMIGRSTLIGIVLSLLYWIYESGLFRMKDRPERKTFWMWMGGLLLFFVPVLVYFYRTDPIIHSNLRFAFEGFFSLWEKGEWDVRSNDILINHMIVFPETLKTWLIGDGYADNPSIAGTSYFDPYYTGTVYKGFYRGTDIGYLRYIFYFGIVGLVAFIAFFIKVTQVCCQRFPMYRMMFLMIFAVNMIGWFKVSTDIFLVLALFLVLEPEELNDKQITDAG